MPTDLLEVSSQLTESLIDPLALAATAGEAVLESVRGGRRYVVYCGHHEKSSSIAAVRLLRRKLHDARNDDGASYEASPLSGQSLSAGDAAWSSVTLGEDCGDDEFVAGCARFGYQLVAYSGRSPVGYCTFAVRVRDGSDEPAASIEIEVLEIWVVPHHRGVGVGASLAEAVAQLALAGLVELEIRLSRAGAPTLFSFAIGADIHSSSGARFLRATASFLRKKIDDLSVIFAGGLQHVLFEDIQLELR